MLASQALNSVALAERESLENESAPSKAFSQSYVFLLFVITKPRMTAVIVRIPQRR
jgi:hypothetical protein